MNQLKTVSDYHKALKQNLLVVLNLFSSFEWMEHNIKIGQSFITFFHVICHFHSTLRKLSKQPMNAFNSVQIDHCLFISCIMTWKKNGEVVKILEM